MQAARGTPPRRFVPQKLIKFKLCRPTLAGASLLAAGTVMTTGISSSLLLAYYQSQAGISPSASSGSNASGTGSTSSTNPTPPWTTKATSQQTNALLQTAISGGTLFNPKAVKVSTANASPNYKNLFALYQGVTALQDLANQAATTGETSGQITQLQTAFASGLGQLQSYLGTQPFRGFTVEQGAVATQEQTSAGVANQDYTYTTGTLVAGNLNSAVSAFQGAVQFTLTAALPSGQQKVVNFNLADMGSETRSLSNVVGYLNSQLKAAGVATTFSVKLTQGQATTTTVNGQTLTTPAAPNQYALQINGNSVEQIALSAPTSAPAVFLTQTAGVTSGATPDAEQQLVKLTTDPTASNAQVFADTLPSVEQNAIATATTSDGSVYVLANVTGATPAGQTGAAQSIVGSQDVALMKYDSAGNLVSSQVVGAAGSASGYGLAVSADGTEVAVTGTADRPGHRPAARPARPPPRPASSRSTAIRASPCGAPRSATARPARSTRWRSGPTIRSMSPGPRPSLEPASPTASWPGSPPPGRSSSRPRSVRPAKITSPASRSAARNWSPPACRAPTRWCRAFRSSPAAPQP